MQLTMWMDGLEWIMTELSSPNPRPWESDSSLPPRLPAIAARHFNSNICCYYAINLLPHRRALAVCLSIRCPPAPPARPTSTVHPASL